MQQAPTRSRAPLPVRSLFVLSLIALLLGGAVPHPGGSGRDYLSYLVLAARQDAEGAGLAAREALDVGGTVVQEYPQIGAVLAYADHRSFADRLRRRPGIAEVGATRTVPSAAPPGRLDGTGDFRAYGSRPVYPHDAVLGQARQRFGLRPADDTPTVPDPREIPPWNLRMIGADKGAEDSTAGPLNTTGGDSGREALRRVVVAVLDSGVDDTHPDLRAAVDPARSASCADGRPDRRTGSWRPDDSVGESGHGTHVAGIIGAARDGDGVVGVAPGVRIAAVRLLGPLGQYYAENIVCGLLWAADHGARAINDSYFTDPWKYNCPEDRDQAATIEAIGRAVRYAQRQGAVVLASAGNDAQDLGAVRIDGRSPNDRIGTSAPPVRTLGPACVRLPAELPGVVAVSALERSGAVAGYSNYGSDRIALAAPGGDPDGGTHGAVVSDWPGGHYAALAGTSMAAAHATGVVALIASSHPDYGSARLREAVIRAASPPRCPSTAGRCPDPSHVGAGLLTVPVSPAASSGGG